MSHLFDQSPLGKGFTLDMFGRLKVSNPQTIFDSQSRYKLSGDFSNVTSNGNITYSVTESCANLNIGTGTGDKVYYETKRVFPYQPGKSLQVKQTFTFNPPKANLRQRAGYFTNDNGIYLERVASETYIVKRSNTTGIVTETRIPQSQWNGDTLLGTGPSGLTLDLTKSQILFSEYEWLGVGSVRVGFAIDTKFIIAHQFNHANYITGTYMTTASLPIRYEIENIGPTSTSSQLKQICSTVISNGGYERKTETWTATRTTGIASTSVASGYAPIVSIRMSPGRTDSVVIPSDVNITGDGQGSIYEYALIRNANVSGGTWITHVPSTGNIEYNANATSMSGGTVVQSGIFASSNQAVGTIASLGEFRFDLQLGRDIQGNSDSMTLAVRHLATGGTVYGSLGWMDLL